MRCKVTSNSCGGSEDGPLSPAAVSPGAAPPHLSFAPGRLGCRIWGSFLLLPGPDLCFPKALREGLPSPLPSVCPSGVSSSRVLIEMARSGDRACSQLCRPPLPGAGAGAGKQNPIHVAGEDPPFQRERGLLSGPLVHPTVAGAQASRRHGSQAPLCSQPGGT